jgi:asparagine synthase (glutamine-hydrolysing)
MCGIFGILLSSFNDINTNTITKSFQLGKKRGPEYSKLSILSDHVIFGFHRLAINGLDNESHQPFSFDGVHVICNGEIYNYKILQKQFNLTLTTHSDCEVILHLYKLMGTKLFGFLDGVFSLCIYDEKTNNVILGRDPYGVRPLYIAHYKNNNVGFCSDIEPLQFDSNIISLHSFSPGTFQEFVFFDGTYLSDICEKYFYCDSLVSQNHFTYKPKPIHYYMINLLRKLQKGIKKRVDNCERDLVCLLSGGLDSSIITAYVNRYYKKRFGKNIRTFNIGMENATDMYFADLVSKHVGTKHTCVMKTENDMINAIPDVIQDIETYDTTTVRASVGNWLIGKYIKENTEAKVIFNGDGADELMGGYLYFHHAPDNKSFHDECVRLLNNISNFDVLRSDKSIASHGLEPRTPFLDKEFTQYYLSIPIEYRNHVSKNLCEKYLIRKAIEIYDPTLLPKEVLWRKKEAFSDGVSSVKRSWYEIIQENCNILQNPDMKTQNLNLQPITNEQQYYYSIFCKKFHKSCYNIRPYYWMPRFINANDSSARTLDVYKKQSIHE